MADGAALDRAIDRRMDGTLRELQKFCSQPSISAQDLGIEDMARMVEESLETRGFSVRRVRTGRHPAILAECRGSQMPREYRGGQMPREYRGGSVLFYNHYDVQPPDPLDQWVTPPFQPAVRDGGFYARGAMDDKGHLVCRLAAIDAVREVYGGLPCTVRFLIEGEEEIASPSLETVIRDNAESLSADLCIWEFGEVDGEGVSMQYLGFRGLLYVELSVQALSRDCHSGIWGTLLPNAAWRLNWALSRIKGMDEKIAVRGFYDRVLPPSDLDMQLMQQLPVISDGERSAMGAKEFIRPHGTPAEFYRNAVLSPSATICGLSSGYQEAGQKTIIPAKASAKLDFRLVPDQSPQEILDKLRAHLDSEGFGDVQVTRLGMIPPSRTPVDHPAVRMVTECATEVYGRPQRVYPMSGGSGPAHYFRKHIGLPVLTAGVGYLGSNIHAPNEHIRLADFRNGIRHTARIMANLDASPGAS
jgi:acetylornithine deacetylase/succinyl-diaminopimelate desuccinylase-like protein